LAIARGDISLATPMMGTKVVFVAILGIFLIGEPLTWNLGIAAVLTAIAVFLLGQPAKGLTSARRSAIVPTIVLAAISALFFAASDLFVARFVPVYGLFNYLPVMMLTLPIYSFALIPFFGSGLGGISRAAWPWLLAGSVFIALQAGALGVILGVYGEATTVNILYAARGLWSVLLVWCLGRFFANREAEGGPGLMFGRLAGAGLLLVAIVLIFA
jgi:drug/metabolite transporter (DMT)-like permease